MTQKHTQGPWKLEPSKNNDSIAYLYDANGYNITSLLLLDADDKANAALIAASPDLLEALKGIVRQIEEEFGDKLIVNFASAKAAIAKAEAQA